MLDSVVWQVNKHIVEQVAEQVDYIVSPCL